MTVENLSGGASTGEVATGGEAAGTGAAATPAASVEKVAAEVGPEKVAVPGASAGAGENPYTPKLKYKVLDQEKDFPDWAKGIVKNPELEKTIRDMLERAEGLDHVKTRRDSLETENKQMREHWAPVIQNVQAVGEMLKKKDYDSFFEAVGIPEIELFKYVNQRLQLREDPQARRAYEQERQLKEYEARTQSAESMVTEMAVQRRSWELDMEMMKPEVSSAIQSFEQRVGRPGAFKTEVIRRGQAYAAAGQDIPASQAVQEVLQLIGWQGTQSPAPTAMQPQAAPQASEPKATLPNIRGKGTSPTKVIPKSVDELRKLAREFRGV